VRGSPSAAGAASVASSDRGAVAPRATTSLGASAPSPASPAGDALRVARFVAAFFAAGPVAFFVPSAVAFFVAAVAAFLRVGAAGSDPSTSSEAEPAADFFVAVDLAAVDLAAVAFAAVDLAAFFVGAFRVAFFAGTAAVPSGVLGVSASCSDMDGSLG
jgi:hypothetical protein